MAWVITEDHITEPGDSFGGAVGISSIDYESIVNPTKFRLFDDDGELYYTGEVDEKGMDFDEDEGGLYQCYQWGGNYAGTTDLQLFENGKWTSIYG